MRYLVLKDYFIITIKYGEPEKTTGPSGVIPIAVPKEESIIVDILLTCI